MSDKNRRIFQNFKLPKLGRRDRQVTPVEDRSRGVVVGQTGPDNSQSQALSTISKNVEDKRTKRDEPRARDMKKELERMKAIERDNRRQRRRHLRKGFRNDLANTPFETCATFCFILVVGTFLFGGGAALIWSGRENDIFDFIVVGATGIVIGAIFTVSGLLLLMKPVCENYQARKAAAALGAWGGEDDKPKETNKPYVDETRRTILSSQICDVRINSRRPSNVELYGDQDQNEHKTNLPDVSFHSCEGPPFLAVPNNEKKSSQKKPVLHLDAKDTTVSELQIEETRDQRDQRDQRDTHYAQLPENLVYEDRALRADDIIPTGETLRTKNRTNEDNQCKTRDLATTNFEVQRDDIDTILRHVSKNAIFIEHPPESSSDSPSPIVGIPETKVVPPTPVRTVTDNENDRSENRGHHSVQRMSSEITVPVHDSGSESDLDADSPRWKIAR